MVAPDDDSCQSGRTWASVVAEEDEELSCVKGLDMSSQNLAGKAENCVVGRADDFGLSVSDQSISPMTETDADDSASTESAASMSEIVSYETVEEERIKGDGVDKFENVSVDFEIKEVVDEKLVCAEVAESESENEVNGVKDSDLEFECDDGIKEEKSLVSGKVDDVVEDEIVKLTYTEPVHVDKTTPNIKELDDHLTSAYVVETTEKEESLVPKSSNLVSVDAKDDDSGEGGCESDEKTEEMRFGVSKSVQHFLEELEKVSSGIIDDHSDETNIPSHHVDRIDGQIVTDSDEEADMKDEGEEKTFDTAALASLLKALTGGSGSTDGNFPITTSQDGLSSSLRPLKPAAASRANRFNIFSSPSVAMGEESDINLSEEEKQKLEKLQSLRVKFLRLLHKLGQSAQDSVAAQVLYRIALLAGRQTGQLFSLDAAKKLAMESEAEGKEDLNFSLNILVLGKSGVGKSATINSIFGDQKSSIHAFGPSTTSVKAISGTVSGGVKITVIDTPGLKSSAMYQTANSKMLSSVKSVMKKYPPDVVLYVDRLDAQNRELCNLPLLKTITASLGPSIWKNAIVTLTHSASAPPDGPSGTPLSYDIYVSQCSYVLQQSIAQAVGLMMYSSSSTPVALVENHSLCRKNRAGEKVLPNGQAWRPDLLLLCYSLKVFSDAVSLFKPQEPSNHRNFLGSRPLSSILSIPKLLSWLLPFRAHLKLPADQGVDSDIELDDDVSDSEQEEEAEDDEYNQLPPFKPLRKTQLAKLSKEHREAYFDEYDYRVKLLQKKQWRDELRRMREMKKKGKNIAGEEEPPHASPPVSLPDMVLPTSFDSDDSAYRYRSLEPTSQFLTKSLLELQGWDHDCGYDSVIAEYRHAIAKRFPATVFVNMTKDKKEFSINLDSSVCARHGDNASTMAGLVIRDVSSGEQLMYVVKGETKFNNLRKNKTTLGGSLIFFNGNVATCVKLEDQITLGKRLVLVGNAGTMRSKEESAYETNLEVRLREADFPRGQNQYALGMSLAKSSKEDLALRGNLRSQVSIGRQTKVAAFASLDNTMTGQLTVRTSSSDQLQIAIMAIAPIAMAIYKRIIRSE